MADTSARNPMLVPSLELATRVLNSPIGPLAFGFHVHSVADTLDEIDPESVMGTFCGLKVPASARSPRGRLRWAPRRSRDTSIISGWISSQAGAEPGGFRRHLLALSGRKDRGAGEPELLRHSRCAQAVDVCGRLSATGIPAWAKGQRRGRLQSASGVAGLMFGSATAKGGTP